MYHLVDRGRHNQFFDLTVTGLVLKVNTVNMNFFLFMLDLVVYGTAVLFIVFE